MPTLSSTLSQLSVRKTEASSPVLLTSLLLLDSLVLDSLVLDSLVLDSLVLDSPPNGNAQRLDR